MENRAPSFLPYDGKALTNYCSVTSLWASLVAQENGDWPKEKKKGKKKKKKGHWPKKEQQKKFWKKRTLTKKKKGKKIHLPMQETRVWALGQEDALEKEMGTHSSILARRIPWTEEPGGL